MYVPGIIITAFRIYLYKLHVAAFYMPLESSKSSPWRTYRVVGVFGCHHTHV